MLGRRVVKLLAAHGIRVRVLSRHGGGAIDADPGQVEFVTGDVRDPASLTAAMEGVETVISAVHGFVPGRGASPKTVDHLGNRNLIDAAKEAGVGHFILISVVGAAARHPMPLFRMKHAAEQELRGSGLSWTIVRATAFMELWVNLVGQPLVKKGKTTVFGRGRNPINFVSADDVAAVVELAVMDPTLRGATIDVGGPANVAFNQVVEVIGGVTGKAPRAAHIPLPVMRLASLAMRPINPGLAAQIRAGVVMDTVEMTFDGSGLRRDFPELPSTSVEEVSRRLFSAQTEADSS